MPRALVCPARRQQLEDELKSDALILPGVPLGCKRSECPDTGGAGTSPQLGGN